MIELMTVLGHSEFWGVTLRWVKFENKVLTKPKKQSFDKTEKIKEMERYV